ncbi:MFS transporter [Catalinimonas sp. 4WD22]|uniref:MFS transporter n=1 Tax=Catalinimonas locisalis TaxID=3133978 RepID=UPI003100B566
MTRTLLKQTNLRIIFSITLMAVMGVSSIAPAFPQIEEVLNVSAQRVGLLITVFTVPGVILTPILGVLADRYGRKKILVPSLLLFGVAGAACFLSDSFQTLLILRTFQGIGAAALGSINVTLIGDLYEGKERATAMGFNASVLSIGTAMYPAIGGAVALLGWNYIFLLPLLSIPVGLIVLYKLDNPEPENDINFKEYLGNTWRAVNQLPVYILFTVSIITFIILYGAVITYFPFLTDQSFEASSFEIGVLMSSMSLTTAFTSSQAGRLSERFTVRKLMLVAFVLYAIALILIPLMPSLWLLLLPVMIFGVAQGMNLPSFMTLLTGYAPLENRAAFMSINGMVLRAGQTMGPIVMAFFFGWLGIAYVYYIGAAFAILMFVLILFFLDKRKS